MAAKSTKKTPAKSTAKPAPAATAEKDPATWVTGDEPMTGPQDSYLHTLAQQAGTEVPDEMTKAEASQAIEELQAKTGRGKAKTGKAKAPKAQSARPAELS